MAWRHGPTPDPGRRSTVRRGATCARTSRGTPGAAPVWHAQADSAASRLVSTEAPDARASLALEARASRATDGGVGCGTLTRRLLVELKNAEVGVSSSATSTGASFRGKPRLRSRSSRRPDHRRPGRSRNGRRGGRSPLWLLSPPFRTARASLAGCRCWMARRAAASPTVPLRRQRGSGRGRRGGRREHSRRQSSRDRR